MAVTDQRRDHENRARPPVAERLGRLADRLLPQRPVALRFWDGSELPARWPREPAGTLNVRGPRALERLWHDPDQVGLGRAWVEGDIDLEGDLERVLAERHHVRSPGLSAADKLRLTALARELGALHRRAPAPPPFEAHVHGRRHSPARDSAAVRFHYDVPFEFYRLVLGPSLVYSCAYFASPEDTLEEAQERKLELLCRKLRLAEGERLLDVGCGWGSLVLHAAARHGVRAVGITLSPAQAEVARARAREAGLADRVEIRVADYRDVADGPYDKIVSVGMYEHVGRAQLPAYARQLAALARPGGLVLNHGIARLWSDVPDDRTFIARYVFPDGELHPVADLVAALQDAGLETRDVESLREHYPLTLRRWLANLADGRDAAIAAGGVERERIWRLYMAGSAVAFEQGDLGVYHVLAARGGAPHGLPLVRQRP